MCDRDGTIFSENDEGWSTTTGTIQKRRENGTRYAEQVTIDLCPSCTEGAARATTPRLPAQLSAPSIADQAAGAEREDDHVMLRTLEQRLAELEQASKPVDAPPVTVPGTVDHG
jgi:hypothetical protein